MIDRTESDRIGPNLVLRSRGNRRRLTLLIVTLAACGGKAPSRPVLVPLTDETSPLRGWRYQVDVAGPPWTLDVTTCFDGLPPAQWVPGSEAAWDALLYAEDAESGRPLPRDPEGLALDASGIAPKGCIRYGVALAQLPIAEGSLNPAPDGNRLVATEDWLWRPPSIPPDPKITVGFDHDIDTTVSVPWPRITDEADIGPLGRPGKLYRLDRTAFSWLSYVAVGEGMPVTTLVLRGLTLRIVEVGEPFASGRSSLETWLADAVDTVSLLYEGRFPIDELQVLVAGDARGDDRAFFGRVVRGGGAGVYLLVDGTADPAHLRGGWTTVHEFIHLGMPYVQDPWMSEGFASYYTEVLRTRRGHRTEEEGWRILERAFERGRNGVQDSSLQRASKRMHETHAYSRVYWSGAAVALLIDVELRRDSGGKVSLDDAMRELHRCCRWLDRRPPAMELLGHLDAWYGKPVFTTVVRRHLGSRRFPDVSQAYANLGIARTRGGGLIFREGPGADIRASIMAPRPLPPSPP